MDHSELFDRLAQSKFRSSFYLKEKDKAYAAESTLTSKTPSSFDIEFSPYAPGTCSDPQ